MEILGIILKYILIGISKFFKFIWAKWKLAGILAVVLLIEVLLLYPFYKLSVDQKIMFIYDFEVVGVEQIEQNDNGKYFLDITIKNYSNNTLTSPPTLSLIVGDQSYYLYSVDYYDSLNTQGYTMYSGNSIPSGFETKITYYFDLYLVDETNDIKDAKIKIADYYGIQGEYEFELKLPEEIPDVF